MISESEWMTQARRALQENRREDAQGILISIVVREPNNDEAWLLLADTMEDPERKMECLVNARRINPHNLTTQRAIQALQGAMAQQAFGQAPTEEKPVEQAPSAPPMPPRPDLAEQLIAASEGLVHQILLTTDPLATREWGLALVHLLEHAQRLDETQTRRWAHSAGRDALVKYEKALTTLVTNLPQHDPQLSVLREQRQRALDLFR